MSSSESQIQKPMRLYEGESRAEQRVAVEAEGGGETA